MNWGKKEAKEKTKVGQEKRRYKRKSAKGEKENTNINEVGGKEMKDGEKSMEETQIGVEKKRMKEQNQMENMKVKGNKVLSMLNKNICWMETLLDQKLV